MYSNKFAAKLVNIRKLCKKDMEKLSIFMVLSTYYPTFRFKKKCSLYLLWEILYNTRSWTYLVRSKL